MTVLFALSIHSHCKTISLEEDNLQHVMKTQYFEDNAVETPL
jgi:hypothetical protein